ncbi:MAG: serine hydrolase domain-containing protein [Gammaproteobacteria bacterium]
MITSNGLKYAVHNLRCLTVLLPFWTGCAAEARAAPVEPPPTESVSTRDDLSTRLNDFDTRLEEMREKLRIPGLALVIVKGASIVYLKGKGYRNLEERLPATEDTLFAIGSTTKAFTALLVLIAVEEDKLALEDSPKKLLALLLAQRSRSRPEDHAAPSAHPHLGTRPHRSQLVT